MKPEDIFEEVPFIVTGGVATRAYAPERQTTDIDLLIEHDRYADALAQLCHVRSNGLEAIRYDQFQKPLGNRAIERYAKSAFRCGVSAQFVSELRKHVAAVWIDADMIGARAESKKRLAFIREGRHVIRYGLFRAWHDFFRKHANPLQLFSFRRFDRIEILVNETHQ